MNKVKFSTEQMPFLMTSPVTYIELQKGSRVTDAVLKFNSCSSLTSLHWTWLQTWIYCFFTY